MGAVRPACASSSGRRQRTMSRTNDAPRTTTAPEEEVDRGDREVANDPDPVRERDHGSTVMSAICTPRLFELDLEAPGNRRRERAAARFRRLRRRARRRSRGGGSRPRRRTSRRGRRGHPSSPFRGRCRLSARRSRPRSLTTVGFSPPSSLSRSSSSRRRRRLGRRCARAVTRATAGQRGRREQKREREHELLHDSSSPDVAARGGTGQRDRSGAGGPRPCGIGISVRPTAASGDASEAEIEARAQRSSRTSSCTTSRSQRASTHASSATGTWSAKPEDECGRRDEDRQPTAVDDPLEMLLHDERREGDERERVGRGASRRVPKPPSTAPQRTSTSNTCGACSRYVWNGSVGVDVSR